MGYIESNLLPDEQIIYKAKLHWTIFLKALFAIVLGVCFLILEPMIGAAVVVFAFLLAIPAFIRYQTSEFGVTTKRVIIKVGFLRRRTLELLLRHVEAISVDQTVPGRLFGYGTVTITGTGGIKESFHNISAPLEFRRRIQGGAT